MNPGQIKISTVIMRGGTSKALFLEEASLPPEREKRDKLILALFGSPDKRQIDGLGGADILTSKLAIIGPASREDADLDYTFGQVSIDEAYVSYDINCGNISAAVGVYAIEEGYVSAQEPLTKVRIHNTNTQKVIISYVPVKNGYPLIEGDFQIDGVPGTGAAIGLDYSQTTGSATPSLLPTGNRIDSLFIPSLNKEIQVSIVDLANLCLFYQAQDLGLTGLEAPDQFTPEQIELIEEVRMGACQYLGLRENPLLPFPVAVAPKATYPSYSTGENIDLDEVDVVVRLANKLGVHKAFPGTVGACAAVAAMIEGTAIWQCTQTMSNSNQTVRLGHPSGVLPVQVKMRQTDTDTDVRVDSVIYARTARRLMEGTAFVRKSYTEDSR